jgi:hypothetical protein
MKGDLLLELHEILLYVNANVMKHLGPMISKASLNF